MKITEQEMEQLSRKCAEKMRTQNVQEVEVTEGHIDRALARNDISGTEARALRVAIKGTRRTVRTAVIEKSGNEWCVFSEHKDRTGNRKKLGCYATKEEAEKRLRQVEYFKSQGRKVEGMQKQGMALPIEGDRFGIFIGTQFFLKSAIIEAKYQELTALAKETSSAQVQRLNDGILLGTVTLTSKDFTDSSDYYRLSAYLSGVIGGSELSYSVDKEAMKASRFRGKSVFGIKNIEGELCPECSKDFLEEGACNKCGYRKAQEYDEVEDAEEALQSPHSDVRYEAVDKVGRQGNVELLVPLLKDPAAMVRHWATRWIGQKGDIRLVEAMLEDPDEDTRIEAIDWVSRRGNKELLEAVAANDTSGLVRDRAKLRLRGRKAQAEDEEKQKFISTFIRIVGTDFPEWQQDMEEQWTRFQKSGKTVEEWFLRRTAQKRRAQTEDEIEDVPIEKGKEERFVEEQEALTPAGPPEVVKTTLPKKYKKPSEEVVDLAQNKTLLDLFSTAEKIQGEITNVEELIDNMVERMTEEKGLEESREKLEGVWKEIRKLVSEQPGRVAKFKDRVYAIMAQRMRVPQPKYKEIAEQLVAEFDDITGRMNARYNVLRNTAKSLKNVYKFFTAPVELYKRGQAAVAEPALAEEPVRALEPATQFKQLDEAVGYSYDILDAISGFSDDLTILGFAISAAEDDLEVLPEAVDLPEAAMKEV